MKTIRCFTRFPSIDRDRWIYPWKEFTAVASYFSSEYFCTIAKHRVPYFLSLHAHLSIEHALESLWNVFFAQFPFKNLMLVYDILHGLICSFNMREILEWWRGRTEEGTFSETSF
jgi:hypothetical protein